MSKFGFVIIIIFIFPNSYAQLTKDKLLGEWVKTKTVIKNGNTTNAKFGKSDEYLRVSFSKEKVIMSQSPYDIGTGLGYKIVNDTIFTDFYNHYLKIPEAYYFVETITDNDLVLKTSFENNDIWYYFKNQKLYQPQIYNDTITFDNDTIVLYLRTLNIPPTYKFYLSNNLVNTIERPRYEGDHQLGGYLSWNMHIRKSLKKNILTKTITVSFIIDAEGTVSSIKIIKGVNEYYNEKFVKLISKTNKKWTTMKNNSNTLTKMIFTFYFL